MNSAELLQSWADTRDQSGGVSLVVLDEIINAAFLVAATSGTANYLARAESDLAPNELLSYLPPRLAGRPADNANLAAETFLNSVDAFDHRLALLSELSTLAVHSSAYKPDYALIAANWRRAASQANALLVKMDAEFGIRMQVGSKESIRLARLLLGAAERGESPCIGDSGLVTVPAPVERRGTVRVTASRNALFDLNGSIQRALIKNVSSRGLGVEGLDGAVAGDEILLMIGPGQSITGHIMWVLGLDAGIRFDAPFPQSFVNDLFG